MLESMLSDNIFEFVNLMDESGEFVFNDRQASRIEKAIAKMEFGFGQGGYQATEFIKRYLPKGFVDLLVVDEGHEYKNSDSAQGKRWVCYLRWLKSVGANGDVNGWICFRPFLSALAHHAGEDD